MTSLANGGDLRQICQYADDEVIGLDNGRVVCWNAHEQESYNTGETPEEYGVTNFTQKERARLQRDGWNGRG